MIKETKKQLAIKGLQQKDINKLIDDLSKYLMNKAYVKGWDKCAASIHKEKLRRKRLMTKDFNEFYDRYCRDLPINSMKKFEKMYFNWIPLTYIDLDPDDDNDMI